MDAAPIAPMTWIGIIVAVIVVIGLSYFAMKAGAPQSKVSEKKTDSNPKHDKGDYTI
jgi:H+/gluconate symporter-like permease